MLFKTVQNKTCIYLKENDFRISGLTFYFLEVIYLVFIKLYEFFLNLQTEIQIYYSFSCITFFVGLLCELSKFL